MEVGSGREGRDRDAVEPGVDDWVMEGEPGAWRHGDEEEEDKERKIEPLSSKLQLFLNIWF